VLGLVSGQPIESKSDSVLCNTFTKPECLAIKTLRASDEVLYVEDFLNTLLQRKPRIITTSDFLHCSLHHGVKS
jgi:hypothetical protein